MAPPFELGDVVHAAGAIEFGQLPRGGVCMRWSGVGQAASLAETEENLGKRLKPVGKSSENHRKTTGIYGTWSFNHQKREKMFHTGWGPRSTGFS